MAAKKYEVHWLEDGVASWEDGFTKPEAFAAARMVGIRADATRVRVLLQIDPPQESGK